MARIDVSGSIGSLLGFYKHERSMFGRCPHCGEPFRLSEVKLTYGKEPPKDLLVRMKRERDRLKEQLEELETEIQETESDHESEIIDLEEDHKHELGSLEEHWRGKVENEVDKRLAKKEREIREDAIAR